MQGRVRDSRWWAVERLVVGRVPIRQLDRGHSPLQPSVLPFPRFHREWEGVPDGQHGCLRLQALRQEGCEQQANYVRLRQRLRVGRRAHRGNVHWRQLASQRVTQMYPWTTSQAQMEQA